MAVLCPGPRPFPGPRPHSPLSQGFREPPGFSDLSMRDKRPARVCHVLFSIILQPAFSSPVGPSSLCLYFFCQKNKIVRIIVLEDLFFKLSISAFHITYFISTVLFSCLHWKYKDKKSHFGSPRRPLFTGRAFR